MALPPFRKVRSEDDVIRQLQGAVELVIQRILSKEILDGNLLEDIELGTGVDNRIEHKLDRPLTGYIVVKKNANATIWDTETTNLLKKSFFNIRTSANCTISLWVF